MPTSLNPGAAPFLPAATSPPSLDSLILAEDPPVVPWHRLPVELKQKIIGEVLDKYEQAEIGPRLLERASRMVGFFGKEEVLSDAKDDAEFDKRRELERLQAVSRDFRSICRPLLWKRLAIDSFAVPALDNLLDVIAPHSSFVRSLDAASFMDEADDNGQDRNPEARLRTLEIVNRCVNVEDVYLDETVIDMSAIDLRDLRRIHLSIPSFADAYPFLLRNCKTLASLNLGLYGVDDGPRERLVTDLVTSLPSLKHLLIEGEDVMSEASFDLSSCTGVVAQLESLELIGDDATVGFATVQAFVGLFSTSLTQLRLELLGDVPELWPVPSRSPTVSLSRLDAFAVGSGFASTFFLHLDLPSLTFLRLEFNPSLLDDPTDLISFLRTHSSSLKHVHLASALISPSYAGDGLSMSDDCVKAIGRTCGEIRCEVSVAGPDEQDEFGEFGVEHGASEDSEDGEDYNEEDEGRFWIGPGGVIVWQDPAGSYEGWFDSDGSDEE